MMEPITIRSRAAARLLGVSMRTLQDWCQKGIIPHRKEGKILLFSPRVLREWADSGPGVEDSAKNVLKIA